MRQLTETTPETAFYLDLYGESDYGPGAYMRNLPNALYVSSIYAPVEVKNRTTDLWGGIKIPSLESLKFDHKDDDWAVVGNVSTYASLLGIPVNSTALKTAAKYAFTLNATAFNTQCGEPELFNIDPDDRKEQLDSAMFALKTPFVDATNERNISLVTYLRAARVRVMHNCTITPNFLLAKVECDSGHCRVSRIKKLADQDGQQTRAMLNRKTWYKIARELPKSTDDQFNGYGSQTERYLYDPQALYPNNHDVDLRNVSVADLSSRFTTIINTYYHATISPSLRLNSLVPSELYFSPHNPPKTAEAIVHTLSPKTYNRRWEWVLSAFVASLALLGVTITGIVYDRRVRQSILSFATDRLYIGGYRPSSATQRCGCKV
ncbi:5028_t:CDS:2 [Acaulospora colombiana]|uniref:5028_t:CDS:1 n=1 Tax=Acaulospora colombiana TaxID=27376 RepID=A0ACA9LJX0_9GLOM|nr:5028_t:CDS:2 [Acaulospora colombiana]